jgi:hypothetical protein
MSNLKKKLATSGGSMDKAGAGEEFGRSLNVTSDLKKALQRAIKDCGLSRIQIADRMNELLQKEGMDEEVSLDVINSWTKDDPKRLIPTKFIPFFCEATSSILPIVAMARINGATVIKGELVQILEIGLAEYEKRRAKQREVAAWSRLGLNHNEED